MLIINEIKQVQGDSEEMQFDALIDSRVNAAALPMGVYAITCINLIGLIAAFGIVQSITLA